ncbi:4-diphosphocytidyl-2-C-methyl-D-erythritol kinase [Fulvitalea axinellae]|uniref:4-diphosphocytidyl-2-C-methyl-D-erythritol kinase n=1 Tax=Fulvitalea axinellae TaxID=1182444 RepID=A0AAU9CFM1_9BACT|nr:4-diphosphocytidyl-2-C-methyl-D-erythritol kinase [Fulvitalea axinellae]
MLTFPNAKINIGLYVTNKRPDGFHDLLSCFVPVPWEEALEILPAEKTEFFSTGIPIPGNPEGNLCLKAYELLRDDFDLPPVKIHLHKAIPIGAGLGGGSADATFTLKALNEMFSLDISDEKLEGYASRLGSDCPFFVKNSAVIAEGTGNIFSPIELDLSGYTLVMVNPGVHVSTAVAYSGITPKPANIDLADFLQKNSPEKWRGVVRNDFEEGVFAKFPVIAEAKENLYDSGAIYAAMSGSGATVFGLFESGNFPELKFPEEYEVKSFEL